MSIITNITGIPLFSTMQEALAWAASNGLIGYHTHSFQGQTGYMGGTNHQQAASTKNKPIAPTSSNSGSSSRSGGY